MCPRLPLISRHRPAKHGYPGVVKRVDWREEYRFVVFSDENRFCVYASDGRTRVRRRPGERHLSECVRPRHIGSTSGFMVWEVISYNSRSHLVFLQGKVNSARYIVQVVNSVLLPFLRQGRDVLFQNDNQRPHTVAATQRALRGVQHLPWPARSPDL